MLFDVDGGEIIIAVEALADDDCVFVVVTFPGHEGDQHVLAQSQLAVVRRGTVGQHAADLHHVALGGDGALVEAGALVGPGELDDEVNVRLSVFIGHDDLTAGN